MLVRSCLLILSRRTCRHSLLSCSFSDTTVSEPHGDPAVAADREVLRDILLHKESYPFEPWKTSYPKRIAIDFSSPNIAKPFHAGHLRSTILGNFVANMYEAKGHHVHRINYFGDWGTQCGIVLAGLERFCPDLSDDKLSLDQLLEIYVKGSELDTHDAEFRDRVRSVFLTVERALLQPRRDLVGDDLKILRRWEKIRDISITEYSRLYERIGVRFDELSGESIYADKARRVATEIENLKLKNGESEYARPERLLKSDGGSLYLSRDLAALLERAERLDFNEMLYVVENGQYDHFQNLFHLAQHFDILKNRKLIHVKFGRIHGLSTRKGNVVLLADLLNEAADAMKLRINSSKNKRPIDVSQTADILGVSTVIVNDFHERRLNDYENASVSLQRADGDSGVFLQYVHARLCSLENRCGIPLNPEFDPNLLLEPEAEAVIRHFQKAPSTVEYAFQEFEPVFIVLYLNRNGHLLNKAMKKLQVKNQEPKISQARLALFHCGRIIASSMMKVLGLKPLEAM